MGKTENRMFSAHDNTKVHLKIHGPESIIGKGGAIEVRVKVNTSWISLLNDKLELQVPQNQGIYISNSRDTRKKRAGSTRRAELDEPVRHYINQYSQDRLSYTAYIRRPSVATHQKRCKNRPSKINPARSNEVTEKRSAVLPLRPCQVALSPLCSVALRPPPPPVAVPSTSKVIKAVRFNGGIKPKSRRSASSWNTSPTNQRVSPSPIQSSRLETSPKGNRHVSFSAVSDPDEVNSIISSVSQESVDLGRQGIPSEDLKSSVALRFAQYDNNNLRLLKNEYKGLKQYKAGKRWQEFGKKAPHLALFVQNIFGN